MAVKLHAGLLKHSVVFKQPSSSLNNEGGREATYSSQVTTWAYVEAVNTRRLTEAQATVLVNAFDFYVRYSSDTSAITKEWLITYKGKDYTIHEIELIEQEENWLRFTGKARE
jgi:SPP1 family predicted phage head-tail adaptor